MSSSASSSSSSSISHDDRAAAASQVITKALTREYNIWGNLLRLGLLFSTLFVLTITSSTSSNSTLPPPSTSSCIVTDPCYIILIDAGSSGTRIHVHSYYFSISSSISSFPIISPSKSLKLRPGLSTYFTSPSLQYSLFHELLAFAEKEIPLTKHIKTPLFLYGTAGLRSMVEKEAQKILKEMKNFLLENYGNKFKIEDDDYTNGNEINDWVKIISGQDEGIYGWIAVNYLLGKFQNKKASQIQIQTLSNSAVGVIEMGGASLQITYSVPANASFLHFSGAFRPSPISSTGLSNYYSDHLHPLSTLNDNESPEQQQQQELTIFTHSYLNYGLEKAQELFDEYFYQKSLRNIYRKIQTEGNTDGINKEWMHLPPSPCYPDGYIRNVTFLVHPSSANPTDPNGLATFEIISDSDPIADPAKLLHFQIFSKGDYNACTQLIRKFILSKKCKKDVVLQLSKHEQMEQKHLEKLTCSLDGTLVPPVPLDGQFLALENFFYTAEFFNLVQSLNGADSIEIDQLPLNSRSLVSQINWLNFLKSYGKNFCAISWSSLLETYPKEPLHDLYKYCFSSVYIPVLLEDGFGYKSDLLNGKEVDIIARKNINGQAIDWAVGAVLKMILEQQKKEKNLFKKKKSNPFNWKRVKIAGGILFGLFLIATFIGAIYILRQKPTEQDEEEEMKKTI